MAGFDMNAIFQQAQALQEQLRKAQDALGQKQVTGDAGGGMVTVTATGRGELLRVQIDPRALQGGDVAMLEDLVLAAVNAALANARALAQQEAGVMPDLSSLLPGMLK